jgi:hypothetical protein
MMSNVKTSVLILMALLSLSSCDDTKRALGIDKSIPDEFAVVRRAPLVMPPNFNLRPPAPGSERPQEGTSSEQAFSALVGRNRLDGYRVRGFSAGEVEFLALAGADIIVPNIREKVDRETSAFASENKNFTEKLIFWSKDQGLDQPLDPIKERQRLDKNKLLGKQPNDRRVPIISKK